MPCWTQKQTFASKAEKAWISAVCVNNRLLLKLIATIYIQKQEIYKCYYLYFQAQIMSGFSSFNELSVSNFLALLSYHSIDGFHICRVKRVNPHSSSWTQSNCGPPGHLCWPYQMCHSVCLIYILYTYAHSLTKTSLYVCMYVCDWTLYIYVVQSHSLFLSQLLFIYLNSPQFFFFYQFVIVCFVVVLSCRSLARLTTGIGHYMNYKHISTFDKIIILILGFVKHLAWKQCFVFSFK